MNSEQVINIIRLASQAWAEQSNDPFGLVFRSNDSKYKYALRIGLITQSEFDAIKERCSDGAWFHAE